MTELILLNNNQKIEIDEKYGVALEGNIQDIRDLETVSGGSSKSLFITGNDEVNSILGSLFNINFESTQFNTNVKQECELWSSGEILMKGFFQIQNISYNSRNQYTYEIWVFDEQINFFLEIEENLITGNDDPTKDLDFSQWNHLWIKENVEDSWDKTPLEIPYFYALFNQSKSFVVNVDDYKPGFYLYSLIEQIFFKYGYRFESEFLNSDLVKEIFIPFSTGDGLPEISDVDAEDRQFGANNDECAMEQQTVGISSSKPYSSTFLDLMYNNILPFVDYGGGQSVTARYRQFIDFHNVVFENTPGLIDPGSGAGFCLQDATNTDVMPKIVPVANNKQTINLDLEFKLELVNTVADNVVPMNVDISPDTTNEMFIRVDLLKVQPSTFLNNGQIWLGNSNIDLISSQFINCGNMPNLSGNEIWNTSIQRQISFEDVQLYKDEEYIVTFTFNRAFWRNTTTNLDSPVTVQLVNSRTKISNEILKSDVREGDTINLNNWLPQNFKQKDLLKSVFKMFNLKMMPSIDDDRTLIIESRDKFYSDGDIIDIQNDDTFYPIDKPSKYNLVTDFQAKEIEFKYADDSDSDEDDIGKRKLLDYKNEYKREYGSQRILFKNENLRDKRTIELDFASTVIGENTGQISEVNNVSQLKKYICGLINAEEPKNAPRILFKNVVEIDDAITTSEGEIPQQIRQYIFPSGQSTGTQANGIPVRQTVTNFVATGTHYRGNNIKKPTFDLNFGRVFKLWFEPETITDLNLYTGFWQNEISTIDQQRMLTASFYISNDRFRKLKYNTIIYFDKNEYSNYYIINKIVEYNAKTGECKLELLTFEPIQTFKYTRPGGGIPINEDLGGGVITRPNFEPGIVIGSGNNTNGTNVLIGNENIVDGVGHNLYGNGNTVIGNNGGNISGDGNEVYSSVNLKGNLNTVSDGSDGSNIIGNNNLVDSSRKSDIRGDNNLLENNMNATVVGNDNEIPNGYENTFIIGNNVDPNDIVENGITTENITITESINFGNSVVINLDLENLQNVEITNPQNNEVLSYDGTEWVNATIPKDFVEITYVNLQTLKNNNDLQTGETYHITDRDIWVTAMDESNLSVGGVRKMRIIKDEFYTPHTVFTLEYLGIYGQTIAQGSVPNSAFGSAIYYAIWGGKMWQRNTSGADGGTNLQGTINGGGWSLMPNTNDTFYRDAYFSIQYDFDEDFVSEQSDWKGNVIKGFIGNAQSFNGNVTSGTNLIDITDWGCDGIKRNNNLGIYNNHTNIIFDNSNDGYIYNNSNSGNIYNNSNNSNIYNNSNGNVINNNSNSGTILGNSNSGAIEYNSNIGSIEFNTNIGSIFFNSNNGRIDNNNNDGFIWENSNDGSIWNNSNNGNIRDNSNNFAILGNSNNGNIRKNSNNDSIRNNSNSGSIEYNSNNGRIDGNNNNGDILNNSNNGIIRINSSNVTSINNNSNNGNIEGNNNNGVIQTNYNAGDINDNINNSAFNIRRNGNAGSINSNTCNGNIEKNLNVGSIINNSNSGNINLNSNNERIDNNSNGGNIFRNSNNGVISNNSNSSYIEYNNNAGDINNNSNTFIRDNTNAGDIFNNSCSGSVSNNSNGGSISDNSNGGAIIRNSNGWYINGNSNGGNIRGNNNGYYINNNNNTGPIRYNSNTGWITNLTNAAGFVQYNNSTTRRITGGSGTISDPYTDKT